MLCTFSLGNSITMETQDDGAFNHDEADVTMISYVLQATNHCKSVIVFSVMTLMSLFYWSIGCIGLVCSARCDGAVGWDRIRYQCNLF